VRSLVEAVVPQSLTESAPNDQRPSLSARGIGVPHSRTLRAINLGVIRARSWSFVFNVFQADQARQTLSVSCYSIHADARETSLEQEQHEEARRSTKKHEEARRSTKNHEEPRRTTKNHEWNWDWRTSFSTTARGIASSRKRARISPRPHSVILTLTPHPPPVARRPSLRRPSPVARRPSPVARRPSPVRWS
jgi:hypothetical protein